MGKRIRLALRAEPREGFHQATPNEDGTLPRYDHGTGPFNANRAMRRAHAQEIAANVRKLPLALRREYRRMVAARVRQEAQPQPEPAPDRVMERLMSR